MNNPSRIDSIADKQVLVLGGAGYLGSVLVRRLLKLKYTVTVYDSFLYGSKSLSSLQQDDFLFIVKGDIRDNRKLSKIIPGKHIIINLAAIVGDAACEINPSDTKSVNATSTAELFNAASKYGAERFIQASTCSVYGCADSLLHENSFLYPVSLYAQSKLASELFLLSGSHKSSTSLTILRFATLFGWSFRPRFDLVVNTMTSNAFHRNLVDVFGGNQWRPHLHVRDAAEAIIAIIEAPLDCVQSEIFNAGGNNLNMTISTLGKKVVDVTPNCVLRENREALDPRNYRVDFTKLSRRLKYKTKYCITDGIREIYDNLLKRNIANPDDPVYSNVKFLQQSAPAHLTESRIGNNSQDIPMKTAIQISK